MKAITKRLRLSQDEWNIIQAKMQENDLNFSQFALEAMLNKRITKQNIKKELILELARIGNNLNQIAKQLNTKKGGMDRVGLGLLSQIIESFEALKAKNGC